MKSLLHNSPISASQTGIVVVSVYRRCVIATIIAVSLLFIRDADWHHSTTDSGGVNYQTELWIRSNSLTTSYGIKGRYVLMIYAEAQRQLIVEVYGITYKANIKL